jgi:predicted transcriptional regulator of viral defense system
MTSDLMLNARTISPSLAPLLSALELNQPELVTIRDISELSGQFQIKMTPARVANELTKRGWLLSSGTKGVYEFSPGANAGAYSRGGELLKLKAASLAHPDTKYALSMSSALYLHGIIKQFPDIPQISVVADHNNKVPYSFKQFDFHKFNTQIGYVIIKNMPVERLETLLVYVCSKPSLFKNCYNITENLGEIWALVDQDLLISELFGHQKATKNRLMRLLKNVAAKEFILKVGEQTNDQ